MKIKKFLRRGWSRDKVNSSWIRGKVKIGWIRDRVSSGLRRFAEEKGQGTTEYAILVGVLVLIAIVAVIAFRDKISELWNSIADGINSL